MRRRDVLLGAACAAGCAAVNPQMPRQPIVIAHRGASGERPEHTLEAYRLAIRQGADFIEPDLVMTRDGVLVCRHENEISATTDVAQRPEFADRRKQKTVDGQSADGWWTEEFTLAELRTLRCRERLPQLRPQNTAFDGQEQIPTFAEVLSLAREAGVGVYPELKHPSLLQALGLDPVAAFVEAVQAAGGQRVADAMFVQCFEVGPLQRLAAMSSLRWRLVQLIAAEAGPWDQRGLTPGAMISAAGLGDIAGYASGVGVEKSLVIPRDGEGRLAQPSDLVANAHAAGLMVHAWTFRAENHFLPAELRRGDAATPGYPAQHGDLRAELRAFYAAGVDGVFSDFPSEAIAARG